MAPGYFLEAFVTGLDFPTAVAFSGDRLWISEAGHLPGLPPKVKEIDTTTGRITTVLAPGMLPAGALLGPLTDVTFHDGMLWITHRQVGANGWAVGSISKFAPENPGATFSTVLTNLPSAGDHFTEEIIFDQTGRAYFSQGTATNSAVVGADNWFITGWLMNFPRFHDFPAKDVVLNGRALQTAIPFPLDPEADDLTAPFMPFGSGPISAGTVVQAASPTTPQQGMIAGNGTVYSFDPTAASPASTLTLEAWGLRNPYGIGLDPFAPGVLFATNNGADIRSVPQNGGLVVAGSRPISNDWDDLFMLNVGGTEEFFGWPDYFHDPQTGAVLPVTMPLFCEPDIPVRIVNCPDFLLLESFRQQLTVGQAFAQFEVHSSANKFDFSTDPMFRWVGDLFVAETGAFVPITGAARFTGYKVVRVDRASGTVSDFIVNLGDTADEIFDPSSFNKPIDVKFRGEVMMIVDFGVFEPALGLATPGTGKLWIVSHGRSGVRKFPQ